jgi:hypothetical protein
MARMRSLRSLSETHRAMTAGALRPNLQGHLLVPIGIRDTGHGAVSIGRP